MSSRSLFCLILPALLTVAFVGPAAAEDKGADAICRDPLLTRMERDLCSDQILHAQTIEEQKRAQAKYRERVESRKKSK